MRRSSILILVLLGIVAAAGVYTARQWWPGSDGSVVYATASPSVSCPEGYVLLDGECITGGDPAFGDGITLVGKRGVKDGRPVVPPGTYRASVSAEYGCYWERRSKADESLEGVIANGFKEAGGVVTVTIKKTDKAFRSSGCGRWEWVGGK